MDLSLISERRRRFAVTFVDDLLGSGGERLAAAIGGRRALVVTTPTVHGLYGPSLRACLARSGLDAPIECLRLGEPRKTLSAVEQVCRLAQKHSLDRKAVLVAFGGGVCSDVVSFAASMIRRGVAHLRVPTTLVGQIDAGVGLKGGVNFNGKKNFLGCFHGPDAVLADRSFLRSLPAREVRQGLAEIVKIAAVRDGELFGLLEAEAPWLRDSGLGGRDPREAWVVRRAVELMLEELAQNPFEDRTLARLVDFGHAFSPSLEAATGFALPHGDAVAIDMALCALIARRLGLLAPGEAERLLALLDAFGLPLWVPELDLDLCREALASTVLHRGGELNLVVPLALGEGGFLRRPEDLPEPALIAALRDLRAAAAASPNKGSAPQGQPALSAAVAG